MTKRTESAVTNVTGVPAYLAALQGKGESLAGMAQHRILPKIGVLQGQSEAKLKEAHGEGAIVLYPSEVCLQGKEEWTLRFQPIFYWKHFEHTSDRRDKSRPNLVEKTFDPESELAIRATNKQAREQQYQGQDGKSYTEKWSEVFNFAGYILDAKGVGTQLVTLVFKGGEHHQGETFMSSQMMRTIDGQNPAEIYLTVWELSSSRRTYGDDPWWGIDFRIPVNNPWASEMEALRGAEMHKKLKQEFADKLLGVSQDAEDKEASGSVEAETSFEE